MDIGNSHVIDWYLWRERLACKCSATSEAPTDFDIETEQREGWAYDAV